jgi:FtsZ-binding cell division protein ZapB
MEDGCSILKKPIGIEFPLGVELLNRPAGFPMPEGMIPIPSWLFPKQLRLTGTLELVSLSPRFDFPLECRPAPNWLMFPRPTGLRLPPNVYLVQFEVSTGLFLSIYCFIMMSCLLFVKGDRGGGILPSLMRRVPMPDIPYGINIPKSVIAIEFLAGAGRPVPYGTELCPGVVVVSAIEGVSAVAHKQGADRINVEDIIHNLPVNAVLVKRKKGSSVPQDVERASGGSLPAGILLAPNVEIWLLSVRFELPAGVKLEAGATLGRYTQLCPNTVLSRDLEVLEWPRNLRLGIGNELVRLSPNCDMPVGYVQVAYSRSELQSYGLGRDSFIVRLPHVLRLPSTQQLSETITAMTVEEIAEKHASNTGEAGRANMGQAKLLSQLRSIMLSDSLPPGVVFIMRDSKKFQLPAEMLALPKSSLPQELRTILADHNVAYPNDGKQAKPSQAAASEKMASAKKSAKKSTRKSTKSVKQRGGNEAVIEGLELQVAPKSEKTYFDLVQLAPRYRFPPGTELAPGVVVQERPHFLHVLPRWVELVKFTPIDHSVASQKAEKYQFGLKLLSRLKYLRASLRPEVNPFIGTKYELPPGTELILIPDDLQVYSWGPRAAGIEAVVQPADILLPPAHYLVERPRNSSPPNGLQMGFAAIYKKLAFQYRLPPGIEVMHVIPTFHLPMGINIISTNLLRCMSPDAGEVGANGDNIITSSRQLLDQQTSYMRLALQTVQLSFGQYLGAGVIVLGTPFGWNRLDNDPSSRKNGNDAFATAIIDEDEQPADTGCLVFVWMDPNDHFLPDGAEIVPFSDEVVSQHFSEYDKFYLDHALHRSSSNGKDHHHHRKRRSSFQGEEAPVTIRRRSLKIVDPVPSTESGLGGGFPFNIKAPEPVEPKPAEETSENGDGKASDRVRITDIVKLVSLSKHIPAPRDRFRERRMDRGDSDSEDEEDHTIVHARVTLLAPDINTSMDSPSAQDAVAVSSSPTKPDLSPTSPAKPDISISLELVEPAKKPLSPEVPPPIVDNMVNSVNSINVGDKDAQQAASSGVATVSMDPSSSAAVSVAPTDIITSISLEAGEANKALENNEVAINPDPTLPTGDASGIGFEALARPHVRLRMGMSMGAMGIEGSKPPDIYTLLQCLDTAQEEIDQLEIENNSYRFKTTTAVREIDYLKTKLDRMTAAQKTRQEEFQAVRDNISELKGTIANLNKTIELRDMDTTSLKRRYEEKVERLKVREHALIINFYI